MKHVVDCINIVPYGTKYQVPFKIIYRKKSLYLFHFKTFRCKIYFRPKKKTLKTFWERLTDDHNLHHEGGDVYQGLAKEGVCRTKHTHAEERKFPRPALFDREDSLSFSDREEDDDFLLETSKCDVDSDLSSHWDSLEYVREHPGTYGVSSDEEVQEKSGNPDQPQVH